mgnify:CR=1 FL=1
MTFWHIIRIAAAYKLVSIVGTELHRYVKHKILRKQIKNNSLNRWDYYLENKLLKNYSKYFESLGEIKLVPDFDLVGSVANVPSKCKIKVYNDDGEHIALIECSNKPTIKKNFNNYYIDIEIVKFKFTPKNGTSERKRSKSLVGSTNERNNGTVEEDTQLNERISRIIKRS